jgi:hypothetical protein
MTALTPGPELDAKVARAVDPAFPDWPFHLMLSDRGCTKHHGRSYSVEGRSVWLPFCSTSLEAAFEAAEKVGLFDDGAFLEKRGNGLWQVTKYRWSGSLTNPDPIVDEIAQGSTPALAICGAILALAETSRLT